MVKRYAQVGIGGRSGLFIEAITKKYRDNNELVAICDINIGRMELCNNNLEKYYHSVPMYHSKDFDRMIKETKPDIVIVTTPDYKHDYYIIRALELGCDVITEKPMTIDHKKCQKIIDTVKKTGKKVRVTFNYRYSPIRSQVKELLMNGVIGEILSVDFHWLLDTRHGADYYRRWHRKKENSGGLMVHKATHHFDLVNWWISSVPVEVFAIGKRGYYIPERAIQLGLKNHGKRCYTCAVTKKCPFYLDLEENIGLKTLYLDQENYDGYYRDKCVFDKEINIEDSMNLVVKYKNNVIMSYSLNSYTPWEGYTIDFNGTKGRLEHKMVEGAHIIGDGTIPGQLIKEGTYIKIYPHFDKPYTVKLNEGTGGHGGGDDPMLEDIFSKNPIKDPLKRSASFIEGAWSILTGIAANISMKTGKPVKTNKLVKGLPNPNFI